MRTLVFGLAFLFTASAGLAAQTGSGTPQDAGDEFEQKQKALRDEIEQLQKKLDGLRKQQQALVNKKKERERQAALEARRKEAAELKAKEEAEKKKQYAKVEIRGKLVQVTPREYIVSINELTWTLHFGDKKELVAAAAKLGGSSVVITGVVVNKKAAYTPYSGLPMPGINPGWPNPNPGWPNPNPGWPNPNPGWPNPGWNPFPYPVESPVIINVESLREAKD